MQRRTLLKSLSLGAGSVVLSPWLEQLQAQAAGTVRLPRRFVFFLQSQGLQSWGVQPREISRKDQVGVEAVVDRPLDSLTLADDLAPLAAHRQRLTVIQGLNGHHVFPYHGGPYGALGGYLKGRTPIAETIDAALAATQPSVFPLVGLGIGAHSNSEYCSSAWGPNRAVPVMCRPEYAHKVLFGSVLDGQDRAEFDSRTTLLDFVKDDVRRIRNELATAEREKLDTYLNAFENMSRRQQQLREMEAALRRVAPQRDERYVEQRETMQLAAHVELASAALIGGLTRTVTIVSGMCGHQGSFRGFTDDPIEMHSMVGHNLGGRSKELYSTLRRHHLAQLATLADNLAAVPEGDGTMLDNTLFVYTSDFGETHHSTGNDWAFVLLGNLGGRLKQGRYLDYPLFGQPGNRSINALYCTLLHAAGAPRDHFNLDGVRKTIDRTGPLDELLA